MSIPSQLDIEGLASFLLKGTQQAALACLPWVGKGDRKAADGAAVAALRSTLSDAPGTGRVVIGEGEKDKAPMLFVGEEVGLGNGPEYDIAVDPLEGTNYCAQGTEGAIAVMAAAPKDSLWSTSAYYMNKIVVGKKAAGSIDINASVEQNIKSVANALAKPVEEIVVMVLDKPRHQELIKQIRDCGASVLALPDGDVMGALRCLLPNGGVDMSMGIGGAPEGVITACSVQLLEGDMQAKLAPQSEDEIEMIKDDPDKDRVLFLKDLVKSPNCCFLATGVTNSIFLPSPEQKEKEWKTSSWMLTPQHRGLFVQEVHPKK